MGGIVCPPMVGMKNAIINGKFDFWQRGTSFSTSGLYTADRWCLFSGQGGTPAATVSRQAFTVGQTDVPGEPTYFLRHAQTGAATTTVPYVYQPIESVRTFAGQQITVSMWLKVASGTLTVVGQTIQYFGTGGSGIVGIGGPSWTVGTTWAKYSYTATVPSIAGKTIAGGNDYVRLAIYGPLNTTYTLDIANVQIEAGYDATDLEVRSPAVELELCQRYFEKSYDTTTNPGTIAANGESYLTLAGGVACTAFGMTVSFKTKKRANAQVTVYSPANGAANAIYDYSAATNRAVSTVDWMSDSGFRWYCSTYGGTAVNTGAQWAADSEL